MNKAKRLTCGLCGVTFLLITLYYGLIVTGPAQYFVAPNAQKIFYFHVPAGMLTYVAFLIVSVLIPYAHTQIGWLQDLAGQHLLLQYLALYVQVKLEVVL